MKYVQAKDIRSGDIIKARHGNAKVVDQFRDILKNKDGYYLGDVTLTIEYQCNISNQNGNVFTFTVPADREIMRVRYG